MDVHGICHSVEFVLAADFSVKSAHGATSVQASPCQDDLEETRPSGWRRLGLGLTNKVIKLSAVGGVSCLVDSSAVSADHRWGPMGGRLSSLCSASGQSRGRHRVSQYHGFDSNDVDVSHTSRRWWPRRWLRTLYTRPPEGGLTPTMAPLPTPLWLRSTRPPLRAVNGRVKAFTRPRKGSVKAVSPLSAESAGSTRGDTVLYHVGVVGALDLRVLRRRSQDPRGAGEDRLCRGHCIITSSPSALPEVACLARREM